MRRPHLQCPVSLLRIIVFTAYDAKERQHWVNRLRATAEHHTDYLAQVVFTFSKCLLEVTNINVNDRNFDQNS